MVQLGTKRTALVLYCVLLVLPTAVLGGLHWRQLRLDHDTDLASVPRDAQDASRRLMDALRQRFQRLVDRESQRPFYEYSRRYFKPGTIGADIALVPSPLAVDPPPEGILGWLQYRDRVFDGTPEVFGGSHEGSPEWSSEHGQLLAAAEQLQELEQNEVLNDRDWRKRWWQLRARHGMGHDEGQEIPVLAINLSQEQDFACLRDALPALRDLSSQTMPLQVTPFHVRFFVDGEGQSHALATRLVSVQGNRDLGAMPPCFSAIRNGMVMVQGFFLDTAWLFDVLPSALGMQVLDPNQQLLGLRENAPPGSEIAAQNVVEELGFETPREEDSQPYTLRVAIDRRDLDSRLRSRELAFLSVAGMLVLSLGTGLVLLFRSVKRDLEAARRTENFVSAVTHELRTPLSAIKLYGEMLAEGWVTDEEKRSEYYRRILRESTRLETLVERVLHKGQLTRDELTPEPGDLVRAVEPLVPLLAAHGSAESTRDLAFELPPDLPLVMLHPECVRSIVTNLVENARKYAPVDLADERAEPIRVRLQRVDRSVRLEVLDRGPGIPAAERGRVFEAFYRLGNEATRTSRGTGLGLHLVKLQADSIGARVRVEGRPGGGSAFRVDFQTAVG